jgi:hypothetical protein
MMEMQFNPERFNNITRYEEIGNYGYEWWVCVHMNEMKIGNGWSGTKNNASFTNKHYISVLEDFLGSRFFEFSLITLIGSLIRDTMFKNSETHRYS